MSKDWTHYTLTCRTCGAQGALSMWMDDWNRSGSELSGFSGRVHVIETQEKCLKCDECGGADVEAAICNKNSQCQITPPDGYS